MQHNKNVQGPSSYLSALPADGDLRRENIELRERLAKFTEASLYVTQSLDLRTVLENCLQGACSLTGAQHGAAVTFNDAGKLEHTYIVGVSAEDKNSWLVSPKLREFFEHLNGLRDPLRVTDFQEYATSLGFPGELLSVRTFLGMPLRYRGVHVGSIYLAAKEEGKEFTPTDEEALLTFASQAATAIANAHRYEEERRAKADLETLINISPLGVAVLDANTGALISLNHEARRIYSTVSHQGNGNQDVLPEITVRRNGGNEFLLNAPLLVELLKSGEQVRAEEMTLSFPDGGTYSAIVNAAPIYRDSGEVSSVVITMQDLTPLEELDRLRAEFLATVSNELRAPLSTIKGSVATLLDSIGPLNTTESEQLLHIIDQQTDLMRSQINSLIELTRIEAGQLAVQPESVDVATLLNEAVAWHKQGKSTVSIEMAIPLALPQAMADRERLGQVLQTLLTLAEQYATDTTAIRVSAVRDDIFVAITVSTNGFAVAASGLSYLFRRFSPYARDFNHQSVSGEGLALAISKGVVEAHGGRIWTGIGPSGRGMSFTFTIPVADDPINRASAAPVLPGAPSALPASEQVRVLVAVDDTGALRSVRNSLFGAGYTPISTFGLDDIDRLVRAEQPHVLLLDLTTAGARGYDLMRRVSSEYGIPAIVLSGQGSDDHIVRAFEMGAADYIVKPFSPSELVARIKASLRKRGTPHKSEFVETYQLDGLRVDFSARSVTVSDRSLRLTPTEYKLLYELATSAGRVLTQNELLQRVWGPEYSGEPQLLRAYVKTLRQKLGDDARNPKYIFTEHGVGYCMPKE